MFSTLAAGSMAYADCAMIDRLDRLYTIQSRLMRDPDTSLYVTDIRHLRWISAEIRDRDVLEAIGGNRLTGRGADFMRFLRDTEALLQRASLDDPQSIRPNRTTGTLATLAIIGDHLNDLRCTALQIAVDSAAGTGRRADSDSDAEDMAEVADTLATLAKEALQIRSLVITVTTVIIIAKAIPLVRRWRRLLRRRAKRHNIKYPTQYKWADHKHSGMLVDISCHGTKLQHDAATPPPIRTTVHIQISNDLIAGTVIWSNRHYSGIQFRRAVSLDTVKLARQTVPHPQKQNGAPKDAV